MTAGVRRLSTDPLNLQSSTRLIPLSLSRDHDALFHFTTLPYQSLSIFLKPVSYFSHYIPSPSRKPVRHRLAYCPATSPVMVLLDYLQHRRAWSVS